MNVAQKLTIIIYLAMILPVIIIAILGYRVGYWDLDGEEGCAIPLGIGWPIVLIGFIIYYVCIYLSKLIDKWADQIKKIENKNESPTCQWSVFDAATGKDIGDEHGKGYIDHHGTLIDLTGKRDIEKL